MTGGVNPPERRDVLRVRRVQRREGRRLGSLARFPPPSVAEPPLERNQRVRGVREKFLYDRLRRVGHPGDEPRPEGLIGVDHAPREREIQRESLADHARQPDGPAPRAEQSEAYPRFGERGRRRGHPEIAGECEFDASAPGGAVDDGHDGGVGRFDCVRDSLAPPGERRRILQVGDRVEIRPRTEGVAGPTERDDGFVRVSDGRSQIVEVLRSEGVAPVRSVERDDPVSAGRFDPNHTGRCKAVSKGLCPSHRNRSTMDDAVRARRAAREALDDIEPDRLRDALTDRIADASMTPGVLALLSARALEPSISLDGIVERAAGVQLIYEGLRLTRTLAHEEPWNERPEGDIDADLDIVAADVLVSRGFYLLARTEAADRAVETVRTFGRDETRRREPDADDDAFDRTLEASVFALAVVAGITAVDGDPPPALIEYADALAHEYEGDLPPAAVAFSDATTERIASLSAGHGHDEPVPSSATDP